MVCSIRQGGNVEKSAIFAAWLLQATQVIVPFVLLGIFCNSCKIPVVFVYLYIQIILVIISNQWALHAISLISPEILVRWWNSLGDLLSIRCWGFLFGIHLMTADGFFSIDLIVVILLLTELIGCEVGLAEYRCLVLLSTARCRFGAKIERRCQLPGDELLSRWVRLTSQLILINIQKQS